MSTNLIIALTIAVAVITNARIVVARSAPMLPSDMLKDLESDAASNRMPYDEYSRYMDGWPYEQRELEQAPPAAEMMRNFEKQLNLAEQLTNSLDEHMKPADEFPEPLPTPQPIKIQPYKKSNSQYHMTICHFKICNMGRKRSATWDADMGRKRDTLHQRF